MPPTLLFSTFFAPAAAPSKFSPNYARTFTKTQRIYREVYSIKTLRVKKIEFPIVYTVGSYVSCLLKDSLPASRHFHNLNHTISVVQGVMTIGRAEGLNQVELEHLILAAWFHDTGYVTTGKNHERVSIDIATCFLKREGYSPAGIIAVCELIRATRKPHRPRNLSERVICDADYYYLSFPDYCAYRELQRREWAEALDLHCSDKGWLDIEQSFLLLHRYHTDFGRWNLEHRKLISSTLTS